MIIENSLDKNTFLKDRYKTNTDIKKTTIIKLEDGIKDKFNLFLN